MASAVAANLQVLAVGLVPEMVAGALQPLVVPLQQGEGVDSKGVWGVSFGAWQAAWPVAWPVAWLAWLQVALLQPWPWDLEWEDVLEAEAWEDVAGWAAPPWGLSVEELWPEVLEASSLAPANRLITEHNSAIASSGILLAYSRVFPDEHDFSTR